MRSQSTLRRDGAFPGRLRRRRRGLPVRRGAAVPGQHLEEARVSSSSPVPLHQRAFEASPSPTLVLDDHGRVVLSNPAAHRLFGTADNDLRHRALEDLLDEEGGSQAHAAALDPTGTGSSRPPGLLARRSDGARLPVWLQACPAGAGYTVASLREFRPLDETAWGQGESEVCWRAAFEQAAVGMARVAVDGQVLAANAALAHMLGCPGGACCARHLPDLIHPEEHGFLARVEQPDHESWTGPVRLVNHHGETLWGRVALSRLRHDDGHGAGHLLVVQDEGPRRQAEAALAQLRARIKALARRQVATQTAMAIAHDLNQPLLAVAAYAEAAVRLSREHAADQTRLRHALEGAMTQARRAGGVVRELLGFLQGGETAPEAVDLNQAVEQVLRLVQANGHTPARTTLALEPGLPPVRAHRAAVEKILANLMDNALEALEAAAPPADEAQLLLCTAREGGMARVSVTDNGPGLDPAVAQQVFEPFFSTKVHGIGMGLAICRALAEADGGELWLEAGDDGGATFHFTLPLVQ